MEQSGKKKAFKFIVLISLLVLPTVLFYFFIYTGVHKVSRLPFYGPVQIVDKEVKGKTVKDTLYFEIPSVSLLTPESKYFNPIQLERSIYIAHFLDFNKMDSIPKQIIFCASQILQQHPDVKFITYIENYKQQTLPKPSTFTKLLEGKDSSWVYVIVPAQSVDSIKTNGYFINDPDLNNKPDPYSIVMVDKERRIRGYFNPTLAGDIKKANGELSYLKKEYLLNYRTHRYYEYDTKIEQRDLKNKKR